MRSITSFATCCNIVLCPHKCRMMFSLCSKWCWPSVKWCCVLRTQMKKPRSEERGFLAPTARANLWLVHTAHAVSWQARRSSFPEIRGGTSSANLSPIAKFTVMRSSLHRRIVAFCRLDTLGSARSLLVGCFASWAVSLRTKQHSVVLYLLQLRYAQSVERMTAVHVVVDPISTTKQNKKPPIWVVSCFGSHCWARTSDIMINSHALYRLS